MASLILYQGGHNTSLILYQGGHNTIVHIFSCSSHSTSLTEKQLWERLHLAPGFLLASLFLISRLFHPLTLNSFLVTGMKVSGNHHHPFTTVTMTNIYISFSQKKNILSVCLPTFAVHYEKDHTNLSTLLSYCDKIICLKLIYFCYLFQHFKSFSCLN